MEKTNWIEEIKEFVRKAMNKGLKIVAYHTLMGEDSRDYYKIRVFKGNSVVEFTITPTKLCLDTSKGIAYFDLTLSKRDLLELDAMILSIEEYNEDMAISDFNNFFGEDNSKPTTIDDLDNEDD
jgi:hypothetical protein